MDNKNKLPLNGVGPTTSIGVRAILEQREDARVRRAATDRLIRRIANLFPLRGGSR